MLEKYIRSPDARGRVFSSSPLLRLSFPTGRGYANSAAVRTFFHTVRWVEILYGRERGVVVFQAVPERTQDAVTVTHMKSKYQVVMYLKPAFDAFGLWELCQKSGAHLLRLVKSSDGLCEASVNFEVGEKQGESVTIF
jgi:hypothetical protein